MPGTSRSFPQSWAGATDPQRSRPRPLCRHVAERHPESAQAGSGRAMSFSTWTGRTGRRLRERGRRTISTTHGRCARRRAYTGVPIAEGTGLGSRMSAYRWHLPGPGAVPIVAALRDRTRRVDLQRRWERSLGVRGARGSVQQRGVLVSTGYRRGAEARALRRGTPAAWQCPADRSGARHPGGQDRTRESLCAEEVFWSRDLLLFEAEGPGARIEIPFDVTEAGRYELLAQVAHSPDYGTYTVLARRKAAGAGTDWSTNPGPTSAAARWSTRITRSCTWRRTTFWVGLN